MFSANDVKELREVTGAGMMDCKKALSECQGDREKAIDYLRAKGLAAAAKKQGRIAAEGVVEVLTNDKGGVVVEVNCETDFVAKNEDFKKFSSNVAKYLLENNVADLDVLGNAKLGGHTVNELVNELTLKIGEKIAVRRFDKFSVNGTGAVGSYVHGGKIGVLLNVTTDKNLQSDSTFKEFLKDVSMHVAASDTKFLKDSDMDQNYRNREAEIYAVQLKEQGKPEAMIQNIVKGKLAKLASEVCLYQQKFVKDPDMSIEQLVAKVEKDLGAKITITKFAKMTLGEGIEKKQDNLAEEVAKMTSGAH